MIIMNINISFYLKNIFLSFITHISQKITSSRYVYLYNFFLHISAEENIFVKLLNILKFNKSYDNKDKNIKNKKKTIF